MVEAKLSEYVRALASIAQHWPRHHGSVALEEGLLEHQMHLNPVAIGLQVSWPGDEARLMPSKNADVFLCVARP